MVEHNSASSLTEGPRSRIDAFSSWERSVIERPIKPTPPLSTTGATVMVLFVVSVLAFSQRIKWRWYGGVL
jgi:hypothetical protein